MPNRDILRFFKGILLFLPLLVIFGGPIFVLYVSGELISVPKILQMQENYKHPVLIDVAYTNFISYYKLQAVLKFHPDVIALSDSRSLPIRSVFFKNNIKFFNASLTIHKMSDFENFLDRIPTGDEPKLIIIGLDQIYFNGTFDKGQWNADFTDHSSENKLPYLLSSMWGDYVEKKFTLKDIFNFKRMDKFGLSAIKKHNGFRNDGSYYYGNETENPNSNERINRFEGTSSAILNGTARYPFGSELAPSTINELKEFLSTCRSRNISVIGYLPPYAHFQIELLKSMGDKHAFMFKLPSILPDIFNKFHFDFFDFSDLAKLGGADEEMLNDTHSGEKATLRLFIVMAKQDKKLMEYAKDPQYLHDRLIETKGPFAVFNENEF